MVRLCIGAQQNLEGCLGQFEALRNSETPMTVETFMIEIARAQAMTLIALAGLHAKNAAQEEANARIARPPLVFPVGR
jgi:hypothetical protein